MSLTIQQAKVRNGPALPGYGSLRAGPVGTHAGDPGIFGDIWGGIKGAIGGAVKGFTGATSAPPPIPTWTLPPQMTFPPTIQAWPQVPKPGARGAVERFLPGGETGMMDDPQYRAGKQAGSGWHWNKSGHFLRDGTWIAPGTKLVRNRKMNPLNPRAVRSSMRRLGRAKTAATDINRVTIRKKKCGSCK